MVDRRGVLGGTVAGLLAAAVSPRRSRAGRTPDVGQLSAIRQSLSGLVRPLAPEELVRPDGFVHAADLSLLALSAALAGDRERYEQLVRPVGRRFLARGPSNRSRAVVRSRRLTPAPSRPETTGAAESLLWAQALLTGAGVFARGMDDRMGRELLDGYLAYAVELDGSWRIETSFDLVTRRFANLSNLADYGPDLLNNVTAGRDGDRFRAAGNRALALLQTAQRPSGLIDVFMQPQIRSQTGASYFSANGIVQLAHVAAVAEHTAVGAPQLVGRVLRFVEPRLASLRAGYDAATGQPHGLEPADVGTLAMLARAAVKTGDERFLGRARPLLLRHASWFARQEAQLDVRLVAQTELALTFLESKERGRDLPASIPSRRPPRA